MPNPPISIAFFQAADLSGYIKVHLKPGNTLEVQHDCIWVTTPTLRYCLPFAEPSLAPDPALTPSLRCPAAVEGMGADGIPTLTIPAGAVVTLVNSRLLWVGKPGDAPPLDGLDGSFTEANRVEMP